MKYRVKSTDPYKLESDVAVFFCWEHGLPEFLLSCAESVKPLIKEAAAKELFTGKKGETLSVTTGKVIGAFKTVIVGIGQKQDFSARTLLESVAGALKQVAKENKPAVVAIIPSADWLRQFPADELVQHLVTASELGTYRFLAYKSQTAKDHHRDIEDMLIAVPAGKIQQAEAGIAKGLALANAATFARDLVNEPSQVTTPSFLAAAAQKIEKESKGAIRVTIWERDACEKIGMHAFLGVARGSDQPPKFIRLEYKHTGRAAKKVVIIGKGITFDTGGLSIKGAENMETMKCDMAGAAAVLGVFRMLTQTGVRAHVVGLIAACENMPSGSALKPGDILKAYNGKTIEVLNTDAEGRLTLADVLSYAAEKEKPDAMIDLATLTGACVVALGQDVAGMWGNDEKLLAAILRAADMEGEPVWQMPLEKSYGDLIKSDIADVKNIGTGRYGGAITAALFLSEFVDSVPWVHLDIAGPAFAEKEGTLTPKGGTGFGVRLLLRYLSTL